MACVERERVIVDGSPVGPDARGRERSDDIVEEDANECMDYYRADDVERESSAVRWTSFTRDIHAA